ncbi:hypothetical protein COU61_02175 [Candidatus Pacearchaeota archaeon CG10_big_fil_rev_8_21_14_0_10_35_13]|nr:MAG: hypothetical protein COU61_02175 [Candidatus Pacearchaeota archaeon CG10_big_fil_rev_8_21_14_0_10_35_13]
MNSKVNREIMRVYEEAIVMNRRHHEKIEGEYLKAIRALGEGTAVFDVHIYPHDVLGGRVRKYEDRVGGLPKVLSSALGEFHASRNGHPVESFDVEVYVYPKGKKEGSKSVPERIVKGLVGSLVSKCSCNESSKSDVRTLESPQVRVPSNTYDTEQRSRASY